MAKVLVFKPGLVGDAEKQALLAAGIIPIETSDPDGVRLIEPEGGQVGAGDLLYAALKACNVSTGAQQHFTAYLFQLVEKAREKPPALPARDNKGRFQKTTENNNG